MNYTAAVEANLNAMGTPASEWSAVGIAGTAEDTDAPNGRPMPVFTFPTGYDSAPTLYPTGPTADSMNCELCGHPIKYAYWLQNDARRWTLMVGSECVTHFAGQSGDRITKETTWAMNRDLVRAYADAVSGFMAEWKVERKSTYFTEYGYKTRTALVWKFNVPAAAQSAAANLENLVRVLRVDDRRNSEGRVVEAASTNAVITRWIKKWRAQADAWVEVMDAAKA